MEPVRIVKLGPSGPSLETATFEEAFGEFSEARGRGRARRAERRADRIQKRKEKKLARISARDEVRRARKEARISRRADAQRMRQEKRKAALESRMARRQMRKGPEDELPLDDEGLDMQDLESTDFQAPDLGGGEGYVDQPTGSPEGLAPEENEGGAEPDEWGGVGSVYETDNNEMGDTAYGTGEEGEYDFGFDGVMGAEDRFYEFSDADGIDVPKGVSNAANKLEWNKELLSRLLVKKAKLQGKNADVSGISNQIEMRKQRIAELENQLTDYANAEGEFMYADGSEEEFSFVRGRGRKLGLGQRKRRAKRVLKAKGLARRERRRLRTKLTPVAKGLRPRFSPNRIVVPASEASSYTGLNGLDLMDDYDAPDTRIVELKSNAAGPKKKINWMAIGIGAGVAVLGIWAIRKYKVFGK